jgi:hypothetical protein
MDENLQLIEPIKEEWLGFLNVDVLDNKEEVSELVDFFYQSDNLKAPYKIFVDSPHQAQYCVNVVNYINKLEVSQTPAETHKMVDLSGISKGDIEAYLLTIEALRDSKELKKVLENINSDLLMNYIVNMISIKKETIYTSFSWYGSIGDYGWLSYYQWLVESKQIEKAETFDKIKQFLKLGVSDTIQLEDLCIIIRHPEYIKRDTDDRLHCVDSFAIKWRDGFGMCYWHGIHTSTKLICFPEEITKEDIANEKNAENRRIYQEKLGDEHFSELLDLTVLDTSTDHSGRELSLKRTVNVDEIAEDYIYYVFMQDHSTVRKYVTCVPPEVGEKGSARDALAWSYGFDSWNEYVPQIET